MHILFIRERRLVGYLKIVGLIAILLSGIGCADFIVSELDARARNVKALCKMLKLIKRMVESFSMSLRDILREMPEGLAEDCGFDRKCV